MTFEQWVRAQGHELAKLTDPQKASLQAAYDSLKAAGSLPDIKLAGPPGEEKKVTAAAGEPAGQPSPEIAALRAEAARISGINSACVKHPDLAAKAIAEDWSVEKATLQAELADLRNARPKAPAVHVVAGAEVTLNARIAEAALCVKHNLGSDKSLLASFGEKDLEAGYRLRGVRFSDMARILAAQGGHNLPLDVGSQAWVKAAFSAADLSGILGNVANRALADILPEPNWIGPQICGTVSHTNFHVHTIYSLSLDGEFTEVAPTGELDHLSLSEESWTRQVKTRGALLGLPRTDMVNDELGAFVENARRLVRKALTGREKAVFAVVNGAVTSGFFSAGHKNYLTGADSALSIDSLGSLGTLFEDQTDASGDPVLIQPEILLTPTGAVKETARAILAAGSNVIISGLASTSAKSVQSNANVYANAYRLLASPMLKASTITGNSALAWYLLANPAVRAAFEIAYLNGVQQPTIQFFGIDTDPNMLGVTWQMFWDFGVNAADYRAAAKSKGAA